MTEEGIRLNVKSLWRTVNAGFLAGIGILGGGNFLGINAPGIMHILSAFALLVIITLASCAPRRIRVAGAVVLTVSLAGAGFAIGIQELLLIVRDYFSWLAGAAAGQPDWVKGYEILQTFLLTVACYLLEIILEKDFRLKIAGILGLASVLLYDLFAERPLPRLCVAFLLCYIVTVYVEWTQRGWEKVRGRSIHAYMLWLMPFLSMYCLLLLLFPVREQPYDWSLVRGVYRQLKESFLKLSQTISAGGNEEYDLALSGFSENGELNGRVTENKKEIMMIQSSRGRRDSVYLPGREYDTFDGRQWKQSGKSGEKERYMDTVETLYAVKRYEKEHLRDYLYLTNITISYRFFHTEYLFAPLKIWTLEQGYENLDFRETGGSLLFHRKKGYGTEYEAEYYRLNEGHKDFDQFLEKRQEPEEELLEQVLKDLQRLTGVSITQEEMQDYRESIRERYLREVTLSEDMKKYLAEITEGMDTDVEKLKAIESELSSLAYTRTPGKLPETVTNETEFLDYFLLESGEGYCSHFATAFVLLARAEKIPARYVQGFCIPLENSGETAVYANMAHAWPEVYLEEIGWIPFEPTPGYGELRYRPWETRNAAGPATGVTGGNLQRKDDPEEGDRGEEEPAEVGEISGKNRLGNVLRIMGLIFLSGVGAGAGIFLLEGLIRRYRYKKMDKAGRFQTGIHKNFQILLFMGIKRKEDETLHEFKTRVENMLADEVIHMQFIALYEEFLYGELTIGQEVLEEIMREQRRLVECLRNKKRRMYICYWILAGWK